MPQTVDAPLKQVLDIEDGALARLGERVAAVATAYESYPAAFTMASERVSQHAAQWEVLTGRLRAPPAVVAEAARMARRRVAAAAALETAGGATSLQSEPDSDSDSGSMSRREVDAVRLLDEEGFDPALLEETTGFDFRSTPAEVATAREQGMDVAREHLLPIVAAAARVAFPRQVELAKGLSVSADLRSPVDWYPLARRMKRKFIVHAGPTNSGKTYTALQRLRQARSGIYCGPLRLLALEVYEELNEDGVATNLATG